MSIKNILLLFTAVLSAQLLSAQQQSGIFFKITGKGISNPSYLFATTDIAAPILFNPGDSLFMALNTTKAVASMLIVDSAEREHLKELMTLPDNRTFLSYVNNMKFGTVDEQFYMTRGSSLWSHNKYYPLFIRKEMEEGKAGGSGASFEQFLVKLAIEQGKKVIPFYSPEALRQKYSAIPVVLQADMLINYAQNLKERKNEDLYLSYYLNGNTRALFNRAKEIQHFEYFNQINRGQAREIAGKIEQIGKQQPTFFIADAILMAGEDGIIDLLNKAGYDLMAVQAYMQPSGTLSATVEEEVDNERDSMQFYNLNRSYTESYFNNAIPDWVKVVSHQGAFMVRLPEEPKVSVDRLPADKDNINIYTYRSEDRAINTFYLVSYYDYPAGFDPNTKKDFFKDVISRVVRRMGGSLMTEKNISTEEIRGREIEVALEEDYYVRAKFYLVGNRLYQLIIGAADRRAYSPENEAYLNSFKLIRQKKEGWYNLNLGAVQVQLPNEPKREKKIFASANDTIITYQYRSTEENTGIVYLVNYSLYPESFAVGDLSSLYNSLSFKAAAATDGIIIKEEDVKSSGGIKGRYFEIGTTTGKVYRVYLYYNKNRLFQIMLEGTEDTAYSNLARIFVDGYSFSELEY